MTPGRRDRIYEERKVLHMQRSTMKALTLRAVFAAALAALCLTGFAASSAGAATVPKAPPAATLGIWASAENGGSSQRIGADSSDATYRSVLRTHVYPVTGDRQIRMIHREEIKEIIATMSRKGLSPSRTAVARLVINAVRALDHTIWLFERDRRALPQTGASS